MWLKERCSEEEELSARRRSRNVSRDNTSVGLVGFLYEEVVSVRDMDRFLETICSLIHSIGLKDFLRKGSRSSHRFRGIVGRRLGISR